MINVRKEKVLKLKNRCKRLAADGVACRNKINESTGIDRYRAWEEKREIGVVARIHYIAYGLIRGRDYSTIEQKTYDGDDRYSWVFNRRLKLVTNAFKRG